MLLSLLVQTTATGYLLVYNKKTLPVYRLDKDFDLHKQ